MNFKQIYNDKISLLYKDPQKLADMISNNTDLDAIYNNDRTISISGSNDIDAIGEPIKEWVGDIKSPLNMVYDVFKLNKQAFLIKI